MSVSRAAAVRQLVAKWLEVTGGDPLKAAALPLLRSVLTERGDLELPFARSICMPNLTSVQLVAAPSRWPSNSAPSVTADWCELGPRTSRRVRVLQSLGG